MKTYTLVRYRTQPHAATFHAYYNCGWTVGILAPNNDFHIYYTHLPHHRFNRVFERLTTREAHHTASPDTTSPTWRRSIDHIWFTHPIHGHVISRINDGHDAVIRCPETDKFVARVPYHTLTEVPKFASTRRPDLSYLRSTSKEKTPVKKRGKKAPTPVEREMSQAEFDILDSMVDWDLLNIKPVIK